MSSGSGSKDRYPGMASSSSSEKVSCGCFDVFVFVIAVVDFVAPDDV
jgi:CO dehydrogenase/acetyl-CoA synthase beta subunit